MIVDALHAEVSQLAASRREYGGKLSGSVGASLLSLSATDTGGRLWRWFILGLVLLERGGWLAMEEGELC